MAPRRERDRRPGRLAPFRDPKPVILVVCEGRRTEPQYVNGFKAAYHNARVQVTIANEHGTPKTLVEIAKKYKVEKQKQARRQADDNLEYDEVWCVFDIDDHPHLADAKQMARDNGILLAISNPCIELWLLLHFRDDPGMQDRDQMSRLLKQFVPNYDKNIDFGVYFPRYDNALSRARRMYEAADERGDCGCNPTTSFYMLTETIRRV